MVALSECIAPDEILLARLAISKLARTLGGMISLGVSACLHGVPDPKQFFPERLEVVRGFIIVLRCITVAEPSSSRKLGFLREQAAELLELSRQLENELTVLADCKLIPMAEVRKAGARLAKTYGQFFDLLQGFSESLGIPSLLGEDKERGRVMIDQFLATFSEKCRQ